jgi:hypothetical protein
VTSQQPPLRGNVIGLERVLTHFDDVYQQLCGHLRRIGKMQRELMDRL